MLKLPCRLKLQFDYQFNQEHPLTQYTYFSRLWYRNTHLAISACKIERGRERGQRIGFLINRRKMDESERVWALVYVGILDG